MSIVKQKGILAAESDPKLDADVIMTAAVIGWAWERIHAGKNCKVDLEVHDEKKLTEEALKNQLADIETHSSIVAKVNKALTTGGLYSQSPKPTHVMEVGVTPIWTTGGRITGGTGDLPLDDKRRYEPTLPSGLAAQLYNLAIAGSTAHKVGYQGRGAYTGFVSGRSDGQTGLMSTFRHVIPTTDDYGRRWHPTQTSLDKNPKTGQAINIGTGDHDKVWGFIGDKALQEELKTTWGMHLEDTDPTDFTNHPPHAHAPAAGHDIVGYTHGMIQAIYDVHFHKLAHETGPDHAKPYNPGTPYEIAVGNQTTKLASCFPCSIFMEATGHPASSTHIGRGESWSPLYPPKTPTTVQHKAWKECNDVWQRYCMTILQRGLACLTADNKSRVEQTHRANVDLLKTYLTSHSDWVSHANLILDALTIHDSEVKRVERTLVK